MASTTTSPSLCFCGCRLSDNGQGYTLDWYALDFPEGKESSSYNCRLPKFNMVPCDATCATVSVGSKIYCSLGVSRRLLCLDMNHLEIGWREIPSRMKESRISPITVVAHGKIYVMDGQNRLDLWGEVFDPCREIWEPMSSPVPNLDGLSPHPYFAFPLALDDDGTGTGVSRNLLLLAATTIPNPCFYVYDVMAKCWIDPPPKLSSNFFYQHSPCARVVCQPLVVGNTVYWFTTSRIFYAYDLELKQCFRTLMYCLNDPLRYNTYNVVFLHLGGEKFCLLSAVGPYLHLHKLSFSRIVTTNPICSLFPGDLSEVSVEGEWCHKDAPIVLLGGVILDGKLPGDILLRAQLGKIVTHLDSSEEDRYPLLPNPVMPRFQRIHTFDSSDPESGRRARFNSSDPKSSRRARSI